MTVSTAWLHISAGAVQLLAGRHPGASIRVFLAISEIREHTPAIEYRFGSVALHACSSDRAPESDMILSENLVTLFKIERANTFTKEG